MDIEDVVKIVNKSVHYRYASVLLDGMTSYSFPLKVGFLNIKENHLCFTRDDEFIQPTCIPIDEIREIRLRELKRGTLDDWYNT